MSKIRKNPEDRRPTYLDDMWGYEWFVVRKKLSKFASMVKQSFSLWL